MTSIPDHGAEVAAAHGVARSRHWPTAEHRFRAANPYCLACGPDKPTKAVQVHHVNPFHYLLDPEVHRPDLELDPRNLVSACETEHGDPEPNHHELVCHLGNFKLGNLRAREDLLTTYRGLTADAIRADADWQAEERTGRLKALDQMTLAEKHAFRARLDSELPADPVLCAEYGIAYPVEPPLSLREASEPPSVSS